MFCPRYLLRAAIPALILAVVAAPASAQQYVPGRVLVKFKAGVSETRARGLITSVGAIQRTTIPRIGVRVLQLPVKANVLAVADALNRRAETAYAVVDEIRKLDFTPNDPDYKNQWHLPKISAPAAWDKSQCRSSVIVAVLDTGVDSSHPDLKTQIVPGWNFWDNNSNTADVHGHGTAVAGAVAAAGNNATGVASPGFGSAIMPIRISDSYGGVYSSCAAAGLTWAADRGARVANISAQFYDSIVVSDAAQYFQSKGGVVTVSAGNSSLYKEPRDWNFMLTCSATDSSDGLASFTNTGTMVDVAAPGVSIRTTTRGGGYGSWSGTSFSAPVTAGVAALVIAANPGLTGAQAQEIITKSADDFGPAGWDPGYGWGRVNAAKAVAMALGTTVDTTPPSVQFIAPVDGSTIGGTGAFQVSASDNAGVGSVTFYADATLVGTAMASPYEFFVDTTKMTNGPHTFKAVAKDLSGNTAQASIVVNIWNDRDSEAPTITITSPAGGSKVGSKLAVSASASDNVGVVKVQLWVDGKLAMTDTAAPWSFSVNTRKWAVGAHTLQCQAFDAEGNTGWSAVVTVYK